MVTKVCFHVPGANCANGIAEGEFQERPMFVDVDNPKPPVVYSRREWVSPLGDNSSFLISATPEAVWCGERKGLFSVGNIEVLSEIPALA